MRYCALLCFAYAVLAADRVIHIIGTPVGVVGSAILVGIVALIADRQVFYASAVYSFCLLTMLACLAAYHLVSNSSRRKSLRQLDRVAIFLMIARTYTRSRHVDCTVFGR